MVWLEGRRAPFGLAGSDMVLAHPHELVDAALLGQSGVDVAARVDADAVVMATVEARENRSVRIADADLRGLAVVFLLGNVVIAVLAAADVVRPAHAGPLAEELAVQPTVSRKAVHASVAVAVGHIDIAVGMRTARRYLEGVRCRRFLPRTGHPRER